MSFTRVVLVVALVLAVSSLCVDARRVRIGSSLEAEQGPLTRARISTRVGSTSQQSKFDLSGKFWYLDRDKELPHLPATLVCTADCKSPNPQYKATLTGISRIVFGVLRISNNYVGFGQGPAPAIIGGCSDNNFTVILENDQAVGNIFAAYSPCGTKFQGGSSIYTKSEGVLATLKKTIMNDITIWTQKAKQLPGNYILHDRNVASVAEKLKITCTDGCATKQPTLKGEFSGTSFTVKTAPDGYVSFGTLDVKKSGAYCGKTQFTLVVPPTGMASGAAFLAAARPMPECGFAGQAIRIEKA